MLVDLQCFSHLLYYGIHDAYTECGSARNPMHARDLAKPDESMNPYESTMNPIQKTDESMNPYESTMNPNQKTDESMNPLYLMKIKNPFLLSIQQ